MNGKSATLIFWLVGALMMMSLLGNVGQTQRTVPSIPYSQFLDEVTSGGVEEVRMKDQQISIRTK